MHRLGRLRERGVDRRHQHPPRHLNVVDRRLLGRQHLDGVLDLLQLVISTLMITLRPHLRVD